MTIKNNHLIADNNKILKCGNTLSKEVFLSSLDKVSSWTEISLEEADLLNKEIKIQNQKKRTDYKFAKQKSIRNMFSYNKRKENNV